MGMNPTRRGFLASTALVALAAGLPGCRFSNVNLAEMDGVAQAGLVRDKKLSPLELVEAAIKRVEQVNPEINAVVTDFFAEARQKAKAPLPDGPFAGVPSFIKDLNDYKGARRTSGSRLFADYISPETEPLMKAQEEAGFIWLGKTNTPEFGLISTTESLLLGPCRNPWNPEHSVGGSSGGAAAAVASGIVPIAHASDGGGSIRIPASCCGVFGLKPSRGRMPVVQEMPGAIGVEHCVSRSVRDSAVLFAATERNDDAAPLKPVGLVERPPMRPLKIAFSTLSYLGDKPSDDVEIAMQDVAKLCANLGHEMIEVESPYAGEELLDAFITVWSSGPAQLVQLAQSKGLKPEDVLEPWTLGLAEMFLNKPAGAMEEALQYFQKASSQLHQFFAGYDAWLTPVLASAPPKLGEQGPNVPFDMLFQRVTDYVAYTPIHNVAGTPAMSVPLSWSNDGLPIGSQFSAPMGMEKTLFELAFQLEEARPWARKKPGIFASA